MTKYMNFAKSCLIGITLGCIAFPTLGYSEPATCGDRAELIGTLKNRYKEFPVAMGISQKSTEAFEIYASVGGTWTVIMTTSTGLTCVMAAGHSWKDIPQVAMGPLT